MVIGTFCTSGAALVKAGAGVSSEISGALLQGSATQNLLDHWITQHESLINVMTRYNWTDVYTTLDDDVKKILEAIASDLAAIDAIAYDMGGYNSRVEAEDMINVRRDSALRGLAILRDQKNKLTLSTGTGTI